MYIPKIHLNIVLQFMSSCAGSIYPLSIPPKSLGTGSVAAFRPASSKTIVAT